MNAGEFIERGYKYFCLNCNRAYREYKKYNSFPTLWAGRGFGICNECGENQFMSFEEYKYRQGQNEMKEILNFETDIDSRFDILDL